jgi:hypothetical protein
MSPVSRSRKICERPDQKASRTATRNIRRFRQRRLRAITHATG